MKFKFEFRLAFRNTAVRVWYYTVLGSRYGSPLIYDRAVAWYVCQNFWRASFSNRRGGENVFILFYRREMLNRVAKVVKL